MASARSATGWASLILGLHGVRERPVALLRTARLELSRGDHHLAKVAITCSSLASHCAYLSAKEKRSHCVPGVRLDGSVIDAMTFLGISATCSRNRYWPSLGTLTATMLPAERAADPKVTAFVAPALGPVFRGSDERS